MLMVKPLLTVRDFRAGLSDEVADAGELLRNYEFNISQGIVQRVSRFSDALALMDEPGEAPPARGEGGEGGDSARGGVMGFGHKRNVCNLEKKPARRVTWEQQERERLQKEVAAAALKATEQDAKATEQDAKVAALEAKVADMQVLAAHCGSAPVPGPPPSAPIAPPHISAPSAFTHLMRPPHEDNLCASTRPPVARPQEQAAWRWYG